MTIPRDWEATPLERVDDLPRILRAMAEAVREALLNHKRLGNPVAIWQDGRVVWLAPEEISVEDVDPEGRAWTALHEENPLP
jgi:hypothetical protein